MLAKKPNFATQSEAKDANASGAGVRTLVNQVSSESLFAGARELVIKHAGDEYRLRLTNLGKLILTK